MVANQRHGMTRVLYCNGYIYIHTSLMWLKYGFSSFDVTTTDVGCIVNCDGRTTSEY
jgi:hypothetical protein